MMLRGFVTGGGTRTPIEKNVKRKDDSIRKNISFLSLHSVSQAMVWQNTFLEMPVVERGSRALCL